MADPLVLSSPYRPSFGTVPEVLVGREEQLSRHERALLNGPSSREFTQAVIGRWPRPSAKPTAT